jgi:hypothetical protein
MKLRKEFIQYTIEVFTVQYGRPVTNEEAEEIIFNSLNCLEELGTNRKCGEEIYGNKNCTITM